MLHLRLNMLFMLLMTLFAGIPAHAVTLLFADLTNAQENPPAHPTTSTGGFRPCVIRHGDIWPERCEDRHDIFLHDF